GTMSTGQRQRVKLAQAIAHDPDLVLLDEPTDGLDPVQRDDMLELIHRCGNEFGISILLSSHLLEEVERVCSAAVILGDGALVASGSLDSLRGTTNGVVLEVDGSVDTVADLLTRAGLTVAVDGLRITVEGDDELMLDIVRDAVVEAGVGLRRLQPRRTSLEDVFLSVSGGV
ncbi:MAG: ATP-binding cassette domain-containing protein, partial [Acidimicrobiales bacterium]